MYFFRQYVVLTTPIQHTTDKSSIYCNPTTPSFTYFRHTGPFPERLGDIGNHVKNCVHILQYCFLAFSRDNYLWIIVK